MKNQTERIGWLGGVMLAICGLPEAISAIQTGTTGLGWMFLLLWGGGEILALIYTILKSSEVSLRPLLFNYGMNILFILTILTVKILETLN